MIILPGIIKTVIGTDDSPLRFERFCLDICSQLEGIIILPTSPTRDRARDGRSISHPHILCATTSKDYKAKIEKDINNLKLTTHTDSLIYCCSSPLTEKECDNLTAKIKKLNPQLKSVKLLGQFQLVALAERYEVITRTHYGAEIGNLERALLLVPSTTPEAENIGLRLALIVSQAGDDSGELRKELTTRLILDTLLSEGPLSAVDLARIISAQLHLPRSLSSAHVSFLLQELKDLDYVAFDQQVAYFTEIGEQRASELPEDAGALLLEGRTAIRQAIRMLSGRSISDPQYEQLWDNFQDGITDLFYSHGLAIVQMVRSILNEERPGKAGREIFFPIEQLADRVTTIFTDPVQKAEICQAIIDIFSEKDSDAFKWLTQICGIYVMMCSLGFESLSSQQIYKFLMDFRLVPDSDIILSLFCEAEPNHTIIESVINAWKALGGTLYASTIVLEEVAYHAWISEFDYDSYEHSLGTMPDEEVSHLIDNAFVRAFKRLAKNLTSRQYWNQYIKQYKGTNPYDYANMLEILRNEYGFLQMPETGKEYISFAQKVTDFLLEMISKERGCDITTVNKNTGDKARRDGMLFADVHHTRERARKMANAPNISIVSSSRRLKNADDFFRAELGQPDAVISIAAISFLLTLCPQVEMGLTALRSVLFDVGLAKRLNPAQRYVSRIIASSECWDVPWSRRGTLARELSRALISQAAARGTHPRILRERVLRSENPVLSVKIISEALDKMAIDSIPKKEVLSLKAEIESLKAELARTKQVSEPNGHPGRSKHKPRRFRRG